MNDKKMLLYGVTLADLVDKSGVYLIYSKSTRKNYIGSSGNLHHRLHSHTSDLCKGVHHSKKLQEVANKYGLDDLVFSVLEYAEKDDVKRIEDDYLSMFGLCDLLNNQTPILTRKPNESPLVSELNFRLRRLSGIARWASDEELRKIYIELKRIDDDLCIAKGSEPYIGKYDIGLRYDAVIKQLQINYDELAQLINAGELTSKRHGNRQYITKESIEALKLERSKRNL